jgi:ribosomal-protein-alanine N-acetyltransferase
LLLVLHAPEHSETARLILRRPTLADLEAIFAYASDAEVTRWLAFPRHETLDDSRTFMRLSDEAWSRNGMGPYLIASKTTGEVLGSTGLDLQPQLRATTGYVLARAVWGRGHATEVLAGIVDIARSLGLRRLDACVHPDNLASIRVLEKVGFSRVSACDTHWFPNLTTSRPLPAYEYAREL